ncbi:MAG: hypothetical protein R3318_07560, partial [Gammaproteobacteria bacterium]|nr:hypothetical protein [Gammaproteobacteria bacterium]
DTPVEPRDLQVLARLADDLKKYKANPLPMLQVISRGLDQFPMVVLEDLEWAQANDPDYNIGDEPSTTPAMAPPPLVAPGLTLEEPQEALYYQVANINARLDDFDGNYRKAIATINSFAETLRQQQGVTDVTVISLPLNISSDSSLQGTTGSAEKEAPFSMKIALGVTEDETG